MPARSSWKGYLKLSLLNVAVKAYTASNSSSATIRLNQLHEECHSRIKYQKTCPVHGEIPSSEIVSGYEYSKGQYVVIDPKEIDSVRTESDKAINLKEFVNTDAVRPLQFSGKTYYLVPSDPISQKPYRLIHQAMADQDCFGIGSIIMSGKKEIVMLYPIDGLLAMAFLNYSTKVKEPAGFEDELTEVEYADEELELTKQLMSSLVTEDFDMNKYEDTYTDNLRELIDAKVEGRELVKPPEADKPDVINLMDALRMSVEQVSKPAKDTAPTRKKRTAKKTATAKSTARKTTKKKKKKLAKSTTAKKKKSSGKIG